jgi:putative transposase
VRGHLWIRRAYPLPGGQRTGANSTDKGKQGSKRRVVVARGGVPLCVIHSAANVHDSKVLEEAVDAIEPHPQAP